MFLEVVFLLTPNSPSYFAVSQNYYMQGFPYCSSQYLIVYDIEGDYSFATLKLLFGLLILSGY